MSGATGSLVQQKLHNRELALEGRRSHSPVSRAVPVRVNIGTTDECNLFCPTCIFPGHSHIGELAFSDFKRFARELFPLAMEYHSTLFGEPLMTSYFEEIPKVLQQYQTQMSLVTNGMLLTEEKSRLVMPVLRDIKFSFDGATKSTFERTRVGSDFETVLSNIKGFLKVRQEGPYRPSATLLVTLMYRNIRELPDIVELAHELGVERVKGCFMVLRNPYEMSQSLWFHKQLTNEMLEKSEELASSYGMKTKFYKKFDLSHETDGNTGIVNCRFLWEEAWIRGNGDVIPCCNVDAPTVGNVYAESFRSIWNNRTYQEMRRRTATGQPAECCKCCILPNEDSSRDTFRYHYKSLILV